MNILIIILSCISIILLIAFLVILIKFKKLNNEYNSYKREIYRNSNKVNMVEYYLREYKEGKNIYTVFRDLSNLIYCEGENKYDN